VEANSAAAELTPELEERGLAVVLLPKDGPARAAALQDIARRLEVV
jgi:hypothetical protein